MRGGSALAVRDSEIGVEGELASGHFLHLRATATSGGCRCGRGVTAGQADAEAKPLEKRNVDAGPPQLKSFVERSGMTMNVGGVQEQRVQPVRPTLLMLQGGVAFVLLIGWEVMGICSYFLVGHYWETPEARAASLKAFLVTKLGDVPFLIGLAGWRLKTRHASPHRNAPERVPLSIVVSTATRVCPPST